MRALLRKDRAWLVVCMLGGGATLTTTLLQHHLGYVFETGQHLSYLFHAAWIAGLVLGLVAATFDECLGTQEFLRQRPVGLLRVHAARVSACALVLLIWFVVPPLLAVGIEGLAGYSKYWGGWQMRPGRLLELAATHVVAVSACAIGLWAGTLPVHFAWRAVFGAAVLLAGFGAVEEIAESLRWNVLQAFWPSFLVGPRSFVVGHLLLAAVCVAASFVAATGSRDDDHALPRRVRWFAIPLGVVACAVLGSGIASEVQRQQLFHLLFHDYPRVELRGESARLVRHIMAGKETLLQPIDAQHLEVGEPEPEAQTMIPLFWVPLRGPGFDSPAWERRARGVWHPGSIGFELSSNGDVLVERDRMGVLPSRWTGKGEAQARFAPGSWVHWMGDGQASLVVEPAPGGPWRVDEASGHFVPVPLPEADRILDYWIVGEETYGHRVQPVRGHMETRGTLLARGEHATYVVGAAGLRPAPDEGKRVDDSVRLVVVDHDPLTPRVEVQEGSGRVRFAHDYAPRTADETWFAGLAAASGIALRPPLLLGLAHALPPSERRSALMDPLVAGGRRTWIVLAGFAVGCLCAGLCAFHLRRLGAPRATWQYWAVLNVLLGPAALLASLVFERRRAYRTLPPLGAIEPPRIVTQPVPLEVIA